MYLTPEEEALTIEYLEQGYVIRPVEDIESLDWIRQKILGLSHECLNKNVDKEPDDWLNNIHREVSVSNLNNFRLEMISGINAVQEFREKYFELARLSLGTLVGNELAMQMRVNLSIQLPKDESSLLPVHADTWSGDSPYEVVLWVPLVDCYRSKSMYILPPDANERLCCDFANKAGTTSEELFRAIESDIVWLDVPYGFVLIFDQGLPHGNRVNCESESRWSLNCRFKSIFTPYNDKKIGEFFEPITLRAASRRGMSYKYPEVG
jgi:sporadic carbohydrate cluster 2OG-Fe(II) oxygenase